jgi:hypothetical protein
MAEGLIGVVEFMTGALEKGQKFYEFFGPKQPTAKSIAAAFATEVQQIFTTGIAQKDVDDAQSDLDISRAFLTVGGDYANAVKNGETNAQLLGHMDGKDGPPLYELKKIADKMGKWVENPGSVGWDVINRAATLYLALQTYLCTLYQERARISDDAKEKQTQLDNATNAAKTAFETMGGVLINILVGRCQSLSVGEWGYNTASQRHPVHEGGSILSDRGLHGGGDYTLRTRAERNGPHDEQVAIIQRLIGPYQNLLWYGGNKGQAALVAAVDSAGLDRGSADSFKSSDLQKVRAFGDWAASVRASLLALENIGRGGTAPKQDGWRWCNGCGTLFYPPTPGHTQCPRYGAFHQEYGSWGSSNYLVTSDGQGPWRWCGQCGALHRPDGSARCPATSGAHSVEGSGKYTVSTDAEGDEIQDRWRLCSNCGVLHYPDPGNSDKCIVGGGKHANGTENYRLQRFGHWSPPITGPASF